MHMRNTTYTRLRYLNIALASAIELINFFEYLHYAAIQQLFIKRTNKNIVCNIYFPRSSSDRLTMRAPPPKV